MQEAIQDLQIDWRRHIFECLSPSESGLDPHYHHCFVCQRAWAYEAACRLGHPKASKGDSLARHVKFPHEAPQAHEAEEQQANEANGRIDL